ncbi:MAG: 50S ribosomal protein L29 [Candidatus Omnitrophica bacterium]|nr:50S ribosomal protein L29 [Candidatus Omnitrophota bacterium]
MKKSEFNELKDLTINELQQKRDEIAKRLFDQRIQVRLGQAKDTCILRNLRKEIAQLKNVIRKKQGNKDANEPAKKKTD